ncbi:hypothetical protein CXG81DRAFT_26653 [Caulochytrium protostelioides]|uniref:Uncharacterized protein n=1 Tax=Caulochytrium protostelioides TaxID=1555241 RepID=A0A4P9X644_9FUNG|nr:hypothetical protein CXG81DRAFT_26653 [Caulochytrium protostelioides]|eukprot:RKP00628.1 hypothetical protein CXG81DRAFT_26653 [Caulochytrium protostelioides]
MVDPTPPDTLLDQAVFSHAIDNTGVVSVPAKRRRPDYAEKLKRRMDETETVVKAALLKYLRGGGRLQVQDAIRARVETFSQRYHIASIALFGMLKLCLSRLDGAEDVMDAQMPGLTCTTFYQQLMRGVAGTTKPGSDVGNYYQDYPLLAARLPMQRHIRDSKIYTTGAFKYQANVRNHYVLRFEARAKKNQRVFQRASSSLMGLQRLWMLRRICGWQPRRDSELVERSPLIKQTVAAHCSVLGIAADKKAPPGGRRAAVNVVSVA